MVFVWVWVCWRLLHNIYVNVGVFVTCSDEVDVLGASGWCICGCGCGCVGDLLRVYMWVLVCWRLLQNVYVGGGVLATSSEAVDVLEGLQSVYVSVGVFATC